MFSLSKKRRVRQALRLERLEGRNAPSHFGVLATVAEVLHHHGTRPEHAGGVHQVMTVTHVSKGVGQDDPANHDAHDDRGGHRHDDPPGHH